MIDAFIRATEHSQLSQRDVAIEVVFLLRHYRRITSSRLWCSAGRLGMFSSFESGELLARFMMNDGWLAFSAVPSAGKGTSAVQAYEPTEKWYKFLREFTNS